MHIRDYMSTNVISANLTDGLHQTFMRMQERGIRHMPVLDGKEKLAGIISDRDLRRPNTLNDSPTHSEYYALDNSTKVQEVMTSSPDTVSADDDIHGALEILIEKRYGALPVVNAEHRVIGMISAVDLLRAFRDRLQAS